METGCGVTADTPATVGVDDDDASERADTRGGISLMEESAAFRNLVGDQRYSRKDADYVRIQDGSRRREVACYGVRYLVNQATDCERQVVDSTRVQGVRSA